MHVTVKLFGPQAKLAFASALDVVVDEPVTCAKVRDALGDTCAALRPSLASSRLAVNHAYASDDAEIAAGDEVALIGLVGGG